MLRARVLSALVLVPVILTALYMGGPTLAALVLLVAALCCYELSTMFRAAGHRPSPVIMGALALSLTASVSMRPDLLPLVLFLGTAALLLEALGRQGPPLGIALGTGLSGLGALYIGSFLGHVLLLRALPYGLQWTLAALACTWAADTGAFFAGRRWGRRKLCARLSPGKTWEGALGGLVLALLAGSLAPIILPALSPPIALLFGALVTVAAILGDLIESLLKRAAGVKDSGSLIPGHGGMLDRIDSLLLALPAAYYFVLLLRA